jgi:hypothetical protein
MAGRTGGGAAYALAAGEGMAIGGGAAPPPTDAPHMLHAVSVSLSIHPQLGQGFIPRRGYHEGKG